MVRWIRAAAGVACLAAFLCGCSPGQEQGNMEQTEALAGLEGREVQRVTQTASPETEPETKPETKPAPPGIDVNPSGAILVERIPAPSGYQRTEAGEGSFQDYIRSYPLKTPEYVFQEGSLKRWYLSDFL